MGAASKLDYGGLGDAELARLIGRRDAEAVRLVMQRNNQRLFRCAWSIVKDAAEAEDVVQSAYLNAFAAIGRFEGRSKLSTWLTRIAINEALARVRARKRRHAELDGSSVLIMDEYRDKLMRGSGSGASPDTDLARKQIRSLLEGAIARLPRDFRLVFMLRHIEGLSVEETAASLDLLPATVKTRLLRARRRLQRELSPDLEDVLQGAFPFAGAACARVTERVIGFYCGPRSG